MHVKFYMHENLTAVRNFHKNFECNIQILNAANVFDFFYKILHETCKISYAHF